MICDGMAMLGFSRTTWLLLILTDLILTVFLDIPAMFTDLFSGGLATIAIFFFYAIVFVFAAAGFTLFEFLSGRSAGVAFMHGVIASLLLVIPFPVATILGFIASSTRNMKPVFAVSIVLLTISPVFAQVSPSLSPVRANGLSFWEAYSDWVSYEIYSVDMSFVPSFKTDFLKFVNSQLNERIEELNTLSLLYSQGSNSPDASRVYSSLARDVSYSRYLSSLIGSSDPSLVYDSTHLVNVATSLANSIAPLTSGFDVARSMSIMSTVSDSVPSNQDFSGLTAVLLLLTLLCVFGSIIYGVSVVW